MKVLNVITACLAAAAVALQAPAAAAQEPQTVRLAVLGPSSLLWLHAIAEDQGFYESRGLEIQELVASTSPALLQAVSSGSVEAGVSVADLAMRAIDQNAPIVISGAILGRSILRFVGGTGVETAADIAGRPVTAGGVQGGTANLLRYLMNEAGTDGTGAQLVAMANSRDRIVALQNGQVAGSLLIAPFDSMAEREGMKVLGDYEEDYLQTPLILNTSWAEANRETAVALTQATREAADWIYDPANKDEAIDILAAYTNVDRELCAQSYAFIVETQQAIGKGLEVTPASLENLLKISDAVGASRESDQPFDLARYYDPSYLAGE